MANIDAMIVAHAKRKIAEAQAEVDKYTALLSTFGGRVAKAKAKPGPKAGTRKTPTAAIQAMADKRAVEAGTATEEQIRRHVARQQAKTGTGKANAKPNGPIAQARAKRAAGAAGTPPAASLEPESEA